MKILFNTVNQCRQNMQQKINLTLQLEQQAPAAHSASDFSLQVIPSQHGSAIQSSKEPQSHSSSSSIILLPQFLLTSIWNEKVINLD